MNKIVTLILLLLLSSLGYSQNIETVYPKQHQVIHEIDKLEWNSIDSATNYQVIIAEDSLLNVGKLVVSTKSRILKTNLQSNKKYFWKVFGEKSAQLIDSSALMTFTTFNVKEIDSLNVWLRADTGVSLMGNFVNQWMDLSDSSLVLNQSSLALMGELQNNILNGYPAVRFDNSNDQYQIATTLLKPNLSVFSIYNTYNEGIFSSFLKGSNNWFFGPYNGFYRIFNGGFLSGIPADSGKFVSHNIHVLQDTIYQYFNGGLFNSKASSLRPGTSLRLGFRLQGDLLELLVFDGTISDSTRNLVDNYLMDKYAPPVNLGADKKVCSFPDSIKLGIDYALDYQWSTGDTTDAVEIDSAGKYYVTITDMFERQSVDSMRYILDTTNYQVDIGFSDTTICKGDSIELAAGQERYSYSWNTLENTSSITVDSSAVYRVSVQNCLGNTSVDSVRLRVNSPEFSLGADTTTCFNQLIQLQSDSNFTNVNYQWSTGSSNTSIVANASDNYMLTVTDQFNCAFSDSINIAIDSTLIGITLGSDTALCEGNIIGLQNPHSSINQYLWNTGDTTETINLDTAGTYVLTFNDNRCQNKDTVQVTLKGEAPTADFISSDFCFQDSVDYTDLSSPPQGDTIVEWKWLYGDGDSSLSQNPLHLFPSADTFITSLQIKTDKGCIDTTSKLVVIEPKPNAYFRFAGSLCAKSNVSFEDSSLISRGNIAGYLWNFGDTASNINSSNQEDPVHQYDTLGDYQVTLQVESDKGCRDTIVQTIDIAATPNVDFTFSGICLSDSTRFQNQTRLAADSIIEYKWFFNGLNESALENPSVQYITSGSKLVTLRVTTNRGCVDTSKSTVLMHENPVASFQLGSYCEGVPFFVTDQSISQDSISFYQYVFNNRDTSNSPNPQFLADSASNYDLKLLVESEFGCQDSTQTVVNINPKPIADFSILNNGSGAPYKLAVDNKSKDATNFWWYLGTGDSLNAEVPTYTYSDTGSYNLELVAINTENCKDTTQKSLNVLPFYLDAFLEEVFLTETFDERLEVSIRIANTGNNTIENVLLTADLNGEFQFSEQMNERIFKGKRDSYQFNSTFKPREGQKVDFVCVNINRVNGITDARSNNDSLCVKGFNTEFVFKLFPNPIRDRLNLEMVIPETTDITLDIFDKMGREVLSKEMVNQAEGYYLSSFSLGHLKSGLYHLRISFNGVSEEKSFIKL